MTLLPGTLTAAESEALARIRKANTEETIEKTAEGALERMAAKFAAANHVSPAVGMDAVLKTAQGAAVYGVVSGRTPIHDEVALRAHLLSLGR
jgi:hypothetical protein